MKYIISYIRRQTGASLLGMSIFLVAVGLLISSSLALYINYLEHTRTKDNNDTLASAKASILAYRDQNGYFPCPASRTAPLDDPAFGVSVGNDCSSAPVNAPQTARVDAGGGRMVRIGTLPVRTLGLPDKHIVDAYGNRLSYVVTEDMASPGFDWKNVQGAITINDSSGSNSVTENAGTTAFTLLSFGLDSRGAYDLNGNQVQPCGTGIAQENCDDNDATFIKTQIKSYDVTGSATNAYTHSMEFWVNPTTDPLLDTYLWWSDDWNSCSVPCGVGTQTRTVECQNYKSISVSESYCDASTKPATTQPCISNTCTPVDGVCDDTVQNGCTAGTPNDNAVADDATYYKWRCDGQYGGTDSGTCQLAKTTAAGCQSYGSYYTSQPATDTSTGCTSGNYSDIVDTQTQWKWTCTDGSNTVICNADKQVNGVCGDSHFCNGNSNGLCDSGTAANVVYTLNQPPGSMLYSCNYHFDCMGIGGGTNQLNCHIYDAGNH